MISDQTRHLFFRSAVMKYTVHHITDKYVGFIFLAFCYNVNANLFL